MREDRELACDALVLEVLGETEAIPYGMTIITFLKRFSTQQNQPNLLYFDGSNNRNQIIRRIEMIKLFKKGSYKLSALAVVCITCLGVATLTNSTEQATGSSIEKPTVAKEATTKKQILFISLNQSYNNLERAVLFSPLKQSYNNLERAVKAANFKVKVPDELPEGYTFDHINLFLEEELGNLLVTEMFIRYEKSIGKVGFSDLSVFYGGARLEDVCAEIEQDEKRKSGKDVEIKRQSLTIAGLPVLKMTAGKGISYYLWKDDDLLYQVKVKVEGNSEDEISAMISSMKYPDQETFKRYVNNDLLSMEIYDTDDLRSASEAIGFAPKLPIQVDSFKAVGASVGSEKTPFSSYPANDNDWKTQFLSVSYVKKAGRGDEHNFYFMQNKNDGIYEEIKKNGNVGVKGFDVVKVSPSQVDGKEVLKTEIYKINGKLNPGFISYFWKENDICYEVSFQEDEPQQESIVASLMKEKTE